MKKILIFISLFFICKPLMANCKYSDSGNGTAVGVTFSSKIMSDTTLPAGSVLAVKTVGGNVANMKTFNSCGAGDVYTISTSPAVTEVVGVKGVRGGPVYETGIPGIGFEISDARIGSNSQPIPATLGSISAYGLSDPGVQQITVWLIKTKDNIDTSITKKRQVSVSYLAGTTSQVSANSTIARLLRVDINIGPLTFRETSCSISPNGGGTIYLSNIEASQLKSMPQGGTTSKQKEFTLNIDCPTSSMGAKYIYWFNPITENSSSKDGVLLNSIPTSLGGAKDVAFVIKQQNTPIKFFDYTSYSIAKVTKNQSINFTADYYKLSNSIQPGSVRAMFEIIIQEE
ncbi:fimbrial protein [Klebsiella oxytoca]|uniref:fimbrial protein n=1 Tax=Klebsiella oxytoca TaxID=571 RepID=UPI001958B957|nr:fimbrial protein [Klebsiella oxytoca]MBZ7704993.1 fimbrial protein [Klebsiella oxytoca]QRS15720.1 fimbrial protein [Klebsiella oxytoca]